LAILRIVPADRSQMTARSTAVLLWPPISAKDFWTWSASVLAARALATRPTVAARLVQVTRKTAQRSSGCAEDKLRPAPRAVSRADRRGASDRAGRAAWVIRQARYLRRAKVMVHVVLAAAVANLSLVLAGCDSLVALLVVMTALLGMCRACWPRIDLHSPTTNPCCLDRGFAPRLLLAPEAGFSATPPCSLAHVPWPGDVRSPCAPTSLPESS
jgi:hypothetical protein